MALFRQIYVVDTNGQPVTGQAGRIFAVADTGGTTPLSVTDAAGIPMTTVSVSDRGVNQAFVVADQTQVRWISADGTQHVIFESLDAMEERAASAVQTAQSALGQVGAFLQQVGVPGGVAALNAEGNVVDANDDVVGNDTRRAGAVIYQVGANAQRPTQSREVMVLWITDGTEPADAIPGLDYWLNAGVVK